VQFGIFAGHWFPAPSSFAFQWRRCDADGTNCADITGRTRASYTPTRDDLGHTLKAVVVATTGSVSSPPYTTPSSQVVVLQPPIPGQPPTITGGSAPAVGTLLEASRGKWSGLPETFAFQWTRCDSGGGNCIQLPGATKSRYRPTSDDAGSTLRVQVTASNAAGLATAVSGATGVVSGT
jgi:hypothetical protein